MIQEFFIALFKVGLPVGLASYTLVWWALKKGYIGEVASLKSFEQEVTRRRKDKKLKKEGDLFHRKWMAFGGGFYGVVGLLTYAVVELIEVRDFIMNLGGILEFIRNISIGVLVELFVGAIKNFVAAIAWPWYWLQEIRSDHIWIWFGVAYGGYWAGGRMALRKSDVQIA